MRHLPKVSAFLLIAALAACSSQKEPAEAAVKAARDAYNTVDAADQRYAATESKTIRDSLTNAESAMDRAAYPLAIQEATGLPEKIAALKTTIATAKKRYTDEWAKMSTTIPPFLEQVTKKLAGGGGLAKPAAEKAQADLTAASNAWTEATVAAQSGDVGTASAKAEEVRATLLNLAKTLKMKTPAGME